MNLEFFSLLLFSLKENEVSALENLLDDISNFR